jgi:ATP-dependent DNA ligase
MGAGRPADFYGLAEAIASRRRTRPRRLPFDLLALDGGPVVDSSYDERRACF